MYLRGVLGVERVGAGVGRGGRRPLVGERMRVAVMLA